jgi:hypothetical protein
MEETRCFVQVLFLSFLQREKYKKDKETGR